jgi:hypothetical protein
VKEKIQGLLLVMLGAAGVSSVASADPRYCYGNYPGYAIQTFHDYEGQMIVWDQRYAAATYGSYEQKMADQQRRAAGDAALSAIHAQGALLTYEQNDLESFAREVQGKQYASTYNGYRYLVYQDAMRTGWTACQTRAIQDLECDGPSGWRENVQRAKAASAKQYASTYNSTEYLTFDAVATAAWAGARSRLREYLRVYAGQEFRALEQIGVESYGRMAAETYNSRDYLFFRDATALGFQAALNSFRMALRGIPTPELDAVQRTYEGKVNASTYNSSPYVYYRTVRDEARAELLSRPTNPQPQPPYPRDWRCRLTTRSGRYEARGTSEQLARSRARNHCYEREPAYSCNAGSMVCRAN